MKSVSRLAWGALAAVMFVVACAGMRAVQAQERDKYVVSAEAGVVNQVFGNVTLQRKGEKRQRALTPKDNLESGDVVTTGAGGMVEVLLNPGSYVRVGEHSEFEMTDNSLDSLRLKLVKGSGLIEATGVEDLNLQINVETPQTRAVIIRKGIYRINVLPTDATEFMVRKGRAMVGDKMPVTLKGGQKVLVSGGRLEIAKIEKQESVDSLELWSRQRAETLARVNRQLHGRTLASSINSFTYDNWSSLSERFYQRPVTGVWVFSRATSCWVFVSTSLANWVSPYGHNYSSWYGMPCCYNTPNSAPNPPGTTITGGTQAGNNRPTNGNSSPGNNYPGNNSPRNVQPTYMPSMPVSSPSRPSPTTVREIMRTGEN
jgi:hypothetical protein